jgi:hypothetical protein
MGNLESQEEDARGHHAPERVLWYKSMGWVGPIFTRGLITEMRSGLLVSDRPFWLCPLDHRFRLFRKCHSLLVELGTRTGGGALVQ